jgi:hypothetical protein
MKRQHGWIDAHTTSHYKVQTTNYTLYTKNYTLHTAYLFKRLGERRLARGAVAYHSVPVGRHCPVNGRGPVGVGCVG